MISSRSLSSLEPASPDGELAVSSFQFPVPPEGLYWQLATGNW